MRWFIYKCNSKNNDYQVEYGDWNDYFANPDDQWGSADLVPALAELERGDRIIAYQTDRNELVGIVKVRKSCASDTFLYLTPLERIGAKVRPLKQADDQIAKIPALQPGPPKTIYPITKQDAQTLIGAAREACKTMKG